MKEQRSLNWRLLIALDGFIFLAFGCGLGYIIWSLSRIEERLLRVEIHLEAMRIEKVVRGEEKTLTPCQILSRPEEFEGKEVRVGGLVKDIKKEMLNKFLFTTFDLFDPKGFCRIRVSIPEDYEGLKEGQLVTVVGFFLLLDKPSIAASYVAPLSPPPKSCRR